MNFTPIDLEQWPRREHFEHYLTRVPFLVRFFAQLPRQDRE